MMNFTWRSPKRTVYESVQWHQSQVITGVRFAVRKISLASRLELIKKIRDLCLKHEFLRSGDRTEQSEGTLADLLVEKLYLEWGLLAIKGLTIDGAAATIDSLIQSGPEVLTDEIVARIRFELGLSEDEIKNS